MRTHLRKLMGLLGCCVAGAAPLSLSAAPLDFDNDGVSDRTVVTIEQNSSLNWQAVGNSAATALGSLGKNGDNLIPGNWLAPGSPVIGFVRAENGNVTWNLNSHSVTFGKTSDTLISGGDFNGDGVIDGALTRRSGGRLVWHLNTGLFNGGTARTVRFGTKLNTPFFMNPGTSHDWLAVLVKPKEGSLRIELRNPNTGRKRRISRIPRSLMNFARPVPMRRADGKDNLLFVRKIGTRTTAIVLGPAGKKLAQTHVAEQVDVVVGDFLPAPGEELAFATSAGYIAYNPRTKERATISAPPGVAVDEININTFATEDDDGLPAPRDECYVSDPTDGFKTGFIWKPASDTQFGAVVILPGIYKNKVREVRTTRTNGTVIRTLAFKGNANPDPGGMDRPHYIDRTMQGNQYRNQYGSIVIEAELKNGACLSYSIPNPAQRVD